MIEALPCSCHCFRPLDLAVRRCKRGHVGLSRCFCRPNSSGNIWIDWDGRDHFHEQYTTLKGFEGVRLEGIGARGIPRQSIPREANPIACNLQALARSKEVLPRAPHAWSRIRSPVGHATESNPSSSKQTERGLVLSRLVIGNASNDAGHGMFISHRHMGNAPRPNLSGRRWRSGTVSGPRGRLLSDMKSFNVL
jgi:hypothetical protein